MNNSRDDQTKQFSSKISKEDVPKSSILIDVNESIEFKKNYKNAYREKN